MQGVHREWTRHQADLVQELKNIQHVTDMERKHKNLLRKDMQQLYEEYQQVKKKNLDIELAIAKVN